MSCHTICDLPDSMLTQILLNLRTKDSVKTSVLSKRWRNLWLTVPGLHLGTVDFYAYKKVLERVHVVETFMDRFIEFNRGSRLQKLDIICHDFDGQRDRYMELISSLVDLGIQHLHVGMDFFKRNNFMRQNIFKSTTLVSLKLDNVKLKNPEFSVSLPCLKFLHLSYNVCFGKDGPLVVEKLIPGCPVLEDLELISPFHILEQQVLLILHVRSQTLKRCCLGLAISRNGTDFTVEIDAPRLEYMSLSNSQPDSIVVKNLSSLLMLNIHTKHNRLQREYLRKRDILCYFLTGISSVRHIIICVQTLEMLYCYSKLRPIPKFENLYHLQADWFSNSSLQLLPALLESCPNLKNLIFGFYVEKESEKINFTNVPWCLILTLENVEIKGLIMRDDIMVKLVNYFLENAAIYKNLLTSTKISPTCQVIID